MNKIAVAAFFGVVLAVALALGMPGKATAFINDTTARIVPVAGLDITIGGGQGGQAGVSTDKDKAVRDQQMRREHQDAYDRDREAVRQDKEALRRDEESLRRSKEALDNDSGY